MVGLRILVHFGEKFCTEKKKARGVIQTARNLGCCVDCRNIQTYVLDTLSAYYDIFVDVINDKLTPMFSDAAAAAC